MERNVVVAEEVVENVLVLVLVLVLVWVCVLNSIVAKLKEDANLRAEAGSGAIVRVDIKV